MNAPGEEVERHVSSDLPPNEFVIEASYLKAKFVAQQVSAGIILAADTIAHCDGQILVLYDILDITPGRKPRFAANFLSGRDSVSAAIEDYVAAVKDGSYPAPEHCFAD